MLSTSIYAVAIVCKQVRQPSERRLTRRGAWSVPTHVHTDGGRFGQGRTAGGGWGLTGLVSVPCRARWIYSDMVRGWPSPLLAAMALIIGRSTAGAAGMSPWLPDLLQFQNGTQVGRSNWVMEVGEVKAGGVKVGSVGPPP